MLIANKPPSKDKTTVGESHKETAINSLLSIIKDDKVPDKVRRALSDDYRQIENMLNKLEQDHIHIAAIGRVSVGKSSLLNALIEKEVFSVSPLHGETKEASNHNWKNIDFGTVSLIDTPGLDEVDGHIREEITHKVAARSDLILFVIDGDMTQQEYDALMLIRQHNRPIVLVINKADRYGNLEQEQLKASVSKLTNTIIDPNNLVFTTAKVRQQTVIKIDENGHENEFLREVPCDTIALKECLWKILEKEGKTLSALNASLFASHISDKLSRDIIETQQHLASKLIRTYSISKGIGVAVNPVPIADLLAAAAIDVGLILHLSRLYGIKTTKNEAASLVKVICAQMLALIGTVWAVNVISASLKVSTAGLSTLITAGGQGAIAYYSTYIIGQVAKQYFAAGKSWGKLGPKQVVAEILEEIDRDSILNLAKIDIMDRLKDNTV